MNFIEFKNELNNGKEHFCYLLEGEDGFFRKKAVSLIKDAFLSEPEMNLSNFDGENLDFNQVVSSALAFPFMSKKRVTVISEFYPDAKTNKAFKELLENPIDSSVIVISNSKLHDGFKNIKNCCVVSCAKADKYTIVKWIKATFSNYDIEIDGERATLLLEYCLSDMQRIENETNKLIDFIGKGGTVTEDDIRLIVYKDVERNIFKMTELVAQKKYEEAYRIVNDLIAGGEAPHTIIATLYRFYRRMFFSVISGKSVSELTTALSVKEYAVTKSLNLAKKFKKISLKKALDLLSDAEYQIKSGKMGAHESMWLSVFKLMNE